ncbi:MAG: hypothetical protein FWC43_09825, partial [Planctomycetaceae bacterium]|nr:hypothetical protein [Planctomycetaceae bacterium]
YVDPQNEFEGGDFEEDYEVLTPPPEREYGPPRDVFADLFPEGTGSEMSHETHRPASESGQRTRGSKVRGASFPEESSVESETTGEENDPFSHFNKRGGRGSRADQSRRGGRRIDRQPEEDTVGEEAACSRESSSRGRGASGRKVRAIDEEPMDEQSLQEEQEMAQLHRNIPGWEDAILPIVESNIARHANHANRSNSAKKGGRNK